MISSGNGSIVCFALHKVLSYKFDNVMRPMFQLKSLLGKRIDFISHEWTAMILHVRGSFCPITQNPFCF